VRNPGQGARRAVAGLALGAAGMLYSRLGGRRGQQEETPAKPAPAPAAEPAIDVHPHEGSASPEDLERARSELSEELARRAARAD
jgi:hypothetical protein